MNELSEKEVYTRLIESVRVAEECCRQLAHLRGDIRWLRVSGLFNTAREKVTALALGRTAA